MRQVIICGGERGTARQRQGTCPNPVHNWPLPPGYNDAADEAQWRLNNRWSNVRCPACKLYGWRPGKLTEKHQEVLP